MLCLQFCIAIIYNFRSIPWDCSRIKPEMRHNKQKATSPLHCGLLWSSNIWDRKEIHVYLISYIPTWINNYRHNYVLDEITFLFPNFIVADTFYWV